MSKPIGKTLPQVLGPKVTKQLQQAEQAARAEPDAPQGWVHAGIPVDGGKRRLEAFTIDARADRSRTDIVGVSRDGKNRKMELEQYVTIGPERRVWQHSRSESTPQFGQGVVETDNDLDGRVDERVTTKNYLKSHVSVETRETDRDKNGSLETVETRVNGRPWR